MIEKGTRIIIDGVPYIIESAVSASAGKYFLVIDYDNSGGTSMRISIDNLMQKLEVLENKKEISQAIVAWFIDEKIKSGVNTSQMIAVKNKSHYAESQIRKLMNIGEDIQQIVEVLAFSIEDSFWSKIVGTSINTIAIARNDGNTIYQKIKSKMAHERDSQQEKVHQQTNDDLVGVTVLE